MKHLPEPECEMGYSQSQVQEILGNRRTEFYQWMAGQTQTLCDGRSYNHETSGYEESCGGVAHGGVTYSHDLYRFLGGLSIID
jgi:hypothetical protein